MADIMTTTCPRGAKALVFPVLSQAVPAAVSLCASLDRLIVAESDLGGYSGTDPAVDHWITEAEATLADVMRDVTALQAAPRLVSGDQRLRLVGHIIAAVFRCDHPLRLRRLTRLIEERRWVFHVAPGVAGAARVNGLIDALFTRVLTSVALAEGFAAADLAPGTANAVTPPLQDEVSANASTAGVAPDWSPEF
jgi:AcrR family transcriptional regulator